MSLNATMNGYIFASYSHANKSDVENYIKYINDNGFNIIYDDDNTKGLNYGDEWDIKVRKHISSVNCKGIIVFLSKAAITSRAVLNEIDYTRIYHKNYIAVIIEGNRLESLFEDAKQQYTRDHNNYFIAETIHNYFPGEKIYLTGHDLLNEAGLSKIKKLFIEWGLFQTWKGIGDLIHTSENEKARLQTQANGYMEVDERIIGEVMDSFVREDLIVLDLGCSDGRLTFSRFINNDKVKKVIGIDIKYEDIQNANLKAKEKGIDDMFSFYALDLDKLDAVDKIRNILMEQNIKSVDIVFSALLIHFLKNPDNLLKGLHDIISKDGKIILRGSDDGTKIVYPDSELLDSIIERYRKYSETDRYNGRKFYYQLIHAGFRDIKMQFETTDTSEYTREYKEAAFHIGMDFRKRKLEGLLRQNPEDEILKEDYEWICQAIDQLEKRFYEPDFWYFLVNFIAVADA
jgi:SAM-dependent methyltransferase